MNNNETLRYTLVCKNCGKEYELDLKYKDYLKGNYRKFCSRSCANTRHHTKETKEKISAGLYKYHDTVHPDRNVKYCRVCGSIEGECKRPELCFHKIQSWWENFIPFGLDITKFGTTEIYNEFDKAKEVLYNEYIINKLSPRDIYNKYNCSKYIHNSENILHLIKALGFSHRDCSKAVKNAFIQTHLYKENIMM